MLTKRQLLILKYYNDNSDTFITTKQVAEEFKVSTRTVTNELKAIRDYCENFTSFTLKTTPSKGTKLQTIDESNKRKDLKKIKKSLINVPVDNRIENITEFLLNSNEPYISKYTIMSKFYISETTLYKHLSEIKQLLQKFHLSIQHKSGRGYTIIGSELNKRICIGKIGIDYRVDGYIPEEANKIYKVVADTFIEFKYHIDEETLQNITNHIFRSLQRIKHFHFIEESKDLQLENTKEYQISNRILSFFIAKNSIPDTYYKNEISLLAQIILGKLEYTENDDLQKKINQFITHSFDSIYQKFSVNFDSIDNLRLLLVLHLGPLFYRIQSGTELTNPLNAKIHDSFPQAYDIALYFSLLIKDYFNLKVSKDEITYLTLYFNYGLENYPSRLTGKKLLIITSLRKSETILLRHEIFNQYPSQIETINFIHPKTINSQLDVTEYDAIFTTEKDLDGYKSFIPFINLFPTEKDLKKIALAIDGYTNTDIILSKFNENYFYHSEATTKEEALDDIFEKAIDNNSVVNKYQLHQSVKKREQLNSTYFGNGIAIPHPLTPITEETFVSVVILNNKIKWDTENFVNMILLVSIAKNNPKELQFWYYISSFIQNKDLIENAIGKPTFKNFISNVKLSLKKLGL